MKLKNGVLRADPSSLSPTKAVESIGNALQAQYERWQPRARYKQSLDPSTDDVSTALASDFFWYRGKSHFVIVSLLWKARVVRVYFITDLPTNALDSAHKRPGMDISSNKIK